MKTAPPAAKCESVDELVGDFRGVMADVREAAQAAKCNDGGLFDDAGGFKGLCPGCDNCTGLT